MVVLAWSNCSGSAFTAVLLVALNVCVNSGYGLRAGQWAGASILAIHTSSQIMATLQTFSLAEGMHNRANPAVNRTLRIKRAQGRLLLRWASEL